MTCACSALESVAVSAVVPRTTRKSVPLAMLYSTNLVKESKSMDKSSLNGVTKATPRPFKLLIV